MNSHGLWSIEAALIGLLSALVPTLVLAGPVNVNTADAATLAKELEGIGLAKAQAIVAHRDKHGPFRSIEDVGRVKGIGRKTLDRNRDSIRLDGRGTAGRLAAPGGAPPARAAAPAPAPSARPR